MSISKASGRHFFRHYPATIVSGLILFLLAIENLFLHLDIFRTIVSDLDNPLYMKTEEIAFSFALISVAIGIDHYRIVRSHKRRRALEMERLGVARSTMASVHDVVNNTLNNLLLVKLEAEKGNPLSAATLILFGELINDLAAELRTMSEMESVAQRDLSQGLGVLDLRQK